MRITESRLRRIIRSVIKEVRATEDEELLKINPQQKKIGDVSGPDGDETDIADLIRFGNHYPYTHRNVLTQDSQDRLVQLFKSWCNTNNVGGKSPREILKLFFSDYPELDKIIDEDYHARYDDLSGVIKIKKNPVARDQMFAHAEKCRNIKL